MIQSNFGIEKEQKLSKYETVINMDMNLYKMIKYYLRAKDRNLVSKIFKHNKPNDHTLLKLIYEVNPTNKIIFIGQSVYRKYTINYFYDLLAYSYEPSMKNKRREKR
jgi:hypothetical protein